MRRMRASVLLFALVLAFLPLAGCKKLQARDELNKGVRAYKNAQFAQAINHFKRAIELDPQLINARVYLAIAYAGDFQPGSPSEENLQRGQAALKAFEEVLEVAPNNVISLAYLASINFGIASGIRNIEEMRPWAEKSKEYRRRLSELEPNNPEHYYSIAVIDWTLTYKPRMEVKIKLGLKPDEALPRRAREELVAKNEGLVEEGIQMVNRALELKPDYTDALAYLNLLYREKADLVADPDERENYLRQADELHDRVQRLMKQQAEAPAPTT